MRNTVDNFTKYFSLSLFLQKVLVGEDSSDSSWVQKLQISDIGVQKLQISDIDIDMYSVGVSFGNFYDKLFWLLDFGFDPNDCRLGSGSGSGIDFA